jgi:hypothetical protein
VPLDREDVREVGLELEPERERHVMRRLVGHHEMVLHPLADEALAADQERILREPRLDRVPKVKRSREVVDLPRAEQQRPHPVHRESEPGEMPRVVGVEAGRLLDDVPPLVADAERRTLENRQQHRWLT